jgi:UDP-N-acetylmuramoyl-tripeptide--D-alanyl-D-alanine ligase
MNKKEIWDNNIIKNVIDAEVYGKWQASGVCIDSRNIKVGDIFVAFDGEKVDGHDYVLDALNLGASAAIVERIPKNCDPKIHNLIVVKNSFRAMEDLAIFHRSRCNAKIIAVTGSSGKTSTKEQLVLAFSRFGKVYSSIGNFNGRLGLPISLASMPIDTEYGIFELGMSYAGEMESRTKVLRPNVAIITNIFPCHIEHFDSLRGIAMAKSEIFLGMESSGIAIINADTSHADVLKAQANKCGIKRVITFGENSTYDSVLDLYHSNKNTVDIEASILNQKVKFKMYSKGRHHALNSLAVLSVISALGLDVIKASRALEEFNSVKGRGLAEEITIKGGKKILLIDDSYNANPGSVRASLASLDEMCEGRRTIVILSDMRELGEHDIIEHKSLAKPIGKHKIDKLITVGHLMKHLYDEVPEEKKYSHFADYKEVIKDIDNLIQDSDCVLVKGSNGTRIYELVNYLKDNQ